MNQAIAMALSLVAGILLGGIFFGVLSWTVTKGLSAKQPALWFLGSFLLRTGILLAGLYFAGRDHWERMAIALLGVVIARVVVLRLTRPPVESQASPRHASPGKEACDAS
jgi:F1F0 ATPase subunit 2